MARFIRIIDPKVIIVLGQAAFEALHFMYNLHVKCSDIQESGHNTYKDMIRHTYYLDLNGKKIWVLPVYHPGANSKRNCSFDKQIADWGRIENYYKQVK